MDVETVAVSLVMSILHPLVALYLGEEFVVLHNSRPIMIITWSKDHHMTVVCCC